MVALTRHGPSPSFGTYGTQHLEGLRVQYDNTVRDADGSVVEVRSASAPLPALSSLSQC